MHEKVDVQLTNSYYHKVLIISYSLSMNLTNTHIIKFRYFTQHNMQLTKSHPSKLQICHPYRQQLTNSYHHKVLKIGTCSIPVPEKAGHHYDCHKNLMDSHILLHSNQRNSQRYFLIKKGRIKVEKRNWILEQLRNEKQ